MTYFIIKCLLSGVIIGVVSEVARRSPSLGALIVSLPLVSLLSILWLWRDTGDTGRIADHAEFNVLVCPSIATDVPGFACNAAGRRWLLVKFDCGLLANDVTLRRNCMGAGEIWDQPLNIAEALGRIFAVCRQSRSSSFQSIADLPSTKGRVSIPR